MARPQDAGAQPALFVNQRPQPALLAAVDGILRNEAPVTVSIVEKQGKRRRRVRKSVSQEVVRAEVAKDTAALLALTEIHERLAARRVTVARLEALRKAAESLSEVMAAQLVGQGARKMATQATRDAVTQQRAAWGATYQLLRALGQQDERVRSLLKTAAR